MELNSLIRLMHSSGAESHCRSILHGFHLHMMKCLPQHVDVMRQWSDLPGSLIFEKGEVAKS